MLAYLFIKKLFLVKKMRLFYLIWLIICNYNTNVFAQQKLGNEIN